MVEPLTLEASSGQHLSSCGIKGSHVELLVEGAEWESLGGTLVSELDIITQHCCPVEVLI